MFGGFGSITHMIVTLRNNRNLLPAKKGYFKKKNFGSAKNEYLHAAGGVFDIKKASPEELKKLRKKIIKKRKSEARRFTIILCVGLPLIVLGLYFTFNNFSFGFPKLQQSEKADIQKSKEEKYLFYIKDGDAWLAKRAYYNAVFQYKKAQQLFPNDFEVNYRIALGYSYRCQYDFEDCGVGKELIDKLEKQFPTNEKIKDVKAIFVNWGE